MTAYIDKAKVEWFKCKGIAHFEGDEEREFILIDVKHIDELPTIDIVTCKECVYEDCGMCSHVDHEWENHEADYFCADGAVE